MMKVTIALCIESFVIIIQPYKMNFLHYIIFKIPNHIAFFINLVPKHFKIMSTFFSKITRFIFLFFACYVSFSQELPPINVFTTEDYNAENQNWAISQSDNGFMYVANNLDVLPREVIIQTKFTRNITINVPIVSAAMDTVTEAAMAIAIAREGGIGVLALV